MTGSKTGRPKRSPKAPPPRPRGLPGPPRAAAPHPPLAPLPGPRRSARRLHSISGIGPKSAETLARLGLETLGDLLWYLPRRYDDYSQLKTINRLWYGEEVTIIGTVQEIHVRPIRGGSMKLIDAVVSDGSGSLRVVLVQPALDRPAAHAGTGRGALRPRRPVPRQADDEQPRMGAARAPAAAHQPHRPGLRPDGGRHAQVAATGDQRRRGALRTPHPGSPAIGLRHSAGVISLPQALHQIHFPDRPRICSGPRRGWPSTRCSTCSWGCCARSRTGRR